MRTKDNALRQMENNVFFGSLIVLLLAGLTVLYINYITKSRAKRYTSALTQQLWKFIPDDRREAAERIASQRWNWRKLLCSGLMLSALCNTLSVRIYHPLSALVASALLFLLWIVFITVFWYFYVIVDESKEKKDAPRERAKGTDKVEKSEEERHSWEGKVRSGADSDFRLPVTIVTGFLGSGKTTLVKNILNNTVGLRILVIENEIGTEGIDHDLLVQGKGREDIVLMNNGCICCTVRRDLIQTFHGLFSNPALSQLNWVVIETTGLADPAPLIQSLYIDESCKRQLRLDSVLTVVDAKHIGSHIGQYCSGSYRNSDGKTAGAHGKEKEAFRQVVYADMILVNKIDLVTEDELSEVCVQLRSLNPTAELISCTQSEVPVEELLNIRAFDATRNAAVLELAQPGANDVLESRQPIVIRRDKSGKVKSHRMNISSSVDRTPTVSPTSGLCTVSLTTDRSIDLDSFNVWITELLRTKGQELYRLKGILNMSGYEEQFVAQGVHMIFDGSKGHRWEQSQPFDHDMSQIGQVSALEHMSGPHESADLQSVITQKNENHRIRLSRLVLIGLNLSASNLEKGFLACCDVDPK